MKKRRYQLKIVKKQKISHVEHFHTQTYTILGIVLFALVIFFAQLQVSDTNQISGMPVARTARSTASPSSQATPAPDLSGYTTVKMCSSARPVAQQPGVSVLSTVTKTTFKRSQVLDKNLCTIRRTLIGLQSCVPASTFRASVVCQDTQSQGGCYFVTPLSGTAQGKSFCAYATP